MKVSEIRHYYDERLVAFTPDRNIKIPSNEPVMIQAAENGSFLVTPLARRNYCFLASAPPKERAVLQQYLDKRTPMLAYTLPCPKTKSDSRRPVLVQIRFYAQEQSVRSLEMNLDEAFSGKARQTINSPRGLDQALEKEFVLRYDDEEHIIAGFRTSAEEAADEQTAGTLDFIIAGRERYLKIAHRLGPEGPYYACQEILSKLDDEYRFVLLHGKIRFLTEAGRIAAITAACVKDLKVTGKGYLETWTRYGDMYSARTIRRCLEGGVLRYQGSSPRGGAKCLRLENSGELEKFMKAMDALGSRSVAVLKEDPSDIFDQFSSIPDGAEGDEVLQQARGALSSFLKSSRPCLNLTVCEDLDARDNVLPLEGDTDDLPEKGYVMVDTQGERKITERREQARDAIANATCAMPDLAMILEGIPGQEKRARGIQAITPEILARVFPKNEPTPKQKKAIEIALNTPDIALIQGPPGTGKTTVITAIVERLKELYEGDTADYACILVTAYQHAAVENAIERMDNYGLPVIKVGVKWGEKRNLLQQNIESWRLKTLADVERNNPELALLTEQNQLLNIYQAYLERDGSATTTMRLLRDAERAAEQMHIPAGRLTELHQAVIRLEQTRSADTQTLLRRAIMNLPCSETAYEDGGVEITAQVRELLRLHDPKFFASQIQFLGSSPEEDPQRFFSMMAKHRTVALAKLLPMQGDFLPLDQRTEIARILKDLLETAQEQLCDQAQGMTPALLAYRDGLADPYLVREAMTHYSCVSGATNQHSASAAMKQLRRSEGTSWHYDTVIVDEAARSNPLDLMIPLARAKDRIILVGDHRQLPHMVDDDLVAAALSDAEKRGGESLRAEEQAHLKDSLFQRLFYSIKELEKDGIQRTITLDRQYRMHPLLGDFVSDNFYAPYGDNERVYSPDKTLEHFAHALPGLENKACAWLRVPANAGREEQNSAGSWVREAEAEAIVSHLGRMLDSAAGEKLSFGIITFYSGQVRRIKDLLKRKGIAEESGETGWFRLLRGEGENPLRLQVGTVDAFQGKEFDVVYLSIVRSNRRRRYGFLTENRLCVSMSRQKKLLIVAGDPEMVRCADAEENVPALKHFYELCEREGQRHGVVL